jgi:DNA mismatch repair ATPase MutS
MMVLYFFLAVIAGYIIFSAYGKVAHDRKCRKNVQSQWGKKPAKECTPNDYISIGSYFNNVKENSEKFYIDDITWNDLDMNRVFSRINNTQTDIGEEYLYKTLRELQYDKEILRNRNDMIEYFRCNDTEREKIQILLSQLGKLRFLNLFEYISGKRKGLGKSGLFYKILSAAFIVTPFAAAVYPPAVVLFFISMALNISMYFKARDQIVGHLQALGYLVNMIGTAKRIVRLPYGQIGSYTEKLKKCTNRIKGISLNTFFFMFYTTENYFFEIIKIFFLGEPIAYHSIFRLIEKYRGELKTIYETLGELESLIAVASYRESLEYYTLPELELCNTINCKNNDQNNNKKFHFTELYHPLIDNPVANSFDTLKSVLITGSNASGKSTFLKSAAINAIFAQTICTCLAKEYSSCFFNIYSSMALNDNLEAKESYYIVEIKSLKRILQGINPDIPVLCVIDEVLRGTNTIERIAASSEIVAYISQSNCICLCATHDIELAQILNDRVDNYHFQEFFDQEKIAFDYKIYPGQASTRNAIKLLKILGYDAEMVENAENRAGEFISKGQWGRMGGN